MITIDQMQLSDAAVIETMLDGAFGKNRKAKASYRLRDGVSPVPSLSLVIRETSDAPALEQVLGNRAIASVLVTPVHVKDKLTGALSDAMFLGPLAVDPAHQGRGLGRMLLAATLEKADAMGVKRMLLVGCANYYGAFGFRNVLPRHVTLPGGADADRLLVRQNGTVASMPVVGELVPYGEDTVSAGAVVVNSLTAPGVCA